MKALRKAILLLQVLLVRVVNNESLDFKQIAVDVEISDNILDGVNDLTIPPPVNPGMVLQPSFHFQEVEKLRSVIGVEADGGEFRLHGFGKKPPISFLTFP